MKTLISYKKLVEINFSDPLIYLPGNKFKFGSKAQSLLKEVSEKNHILIQMSFKAFVIGIVKKILDKSPLKRPLIRNLSWLLPETISDGGGNFFFFDYIF